MAVGVREEDQLDDATRAFEDLRAEVTVLRRAVEALGPALKENRAPDYSLTLGQIAKTQATVRERILRRWRTTRRCRRHRRPSGSSGSGRWRRPRERPCVTPRAPPGRFRGRTKRRRRCSLRPYPRGAELAASAGGRDRLVAGLTLFPLWGFRWRAILPFGSLPDRLATAALGEDGSAPGWADAARQTPRSGGPSMRACSDRKRPVTN